MQNFQMRTMTKDDVPFLVKSVLMSYRAGSRYIRGINKDSFLRSHNNLILSVLSHPSTEAKLIVDKKDESLILGFIVFTGLEKIMICHYIYVRNDFRGTGIASQLLEELARKANSESKILVLSHQTDTIKPARFKKYGFEKVYFDPYIFEALC